MEQEKKGRERREEGNGGGGAREREERERRGEGRRRGKEGERKGRGYVDFCTSMGKHCYDLLQCKLNHVIFWFAASGAEPPAAGPTVGVERGAPGHSAAAEGGTQPHLAPCGNQCQA